MFGNCFVLIYFQQGSLIGIHITILVIYVLIIPVLVYYCNKNEFVKETLYNGWLPIIIAMLISRQVIKLFKKIFKIKIKSYIFI